MILSGYIIEICEALNICNIKFGMIEENRPNAFTDLDEYGVWKVVVTTDFFNLLGNMLPGKNEDASEKRAVIEIEDVKKIFLATVGHELGHVFYKDKFRTKKRMLVASIIHIFILILGILLIAMGEVSIFFVFAGVALWIFAAVIGNVMCDRRYWEQIAELKADRIAVCYVNGGREGFIRFWGGYERIEKEEDKTKQIDGENALYKYYKRHLECEAHPCMRRRIELAKERDRWEWWEYFEHAWMIIKWRRNHLGWNGI